MKKYKEENGVLYTEYWIDEPDGRNSIRLFHPVWVRSRRKNIKDTWRYKLWYHLPDIIEAGFGLVFGLMAIATTIILIAALCAVWKMLI